MPTLNWIGKDAVLNHHKEVPFRLLKCRADLSVGDPDSGNLLVQGDNLEALKALLPYYAGQVKCIYIDPPYNTGNEGWAYNDNVNSPEMKNWLGKAVGSKSEDLSRHDKWLCMMFPRLTLLRDFLKDEGVILISIDDNEISNLRLMMDEIFGEENFIAQLIWEKGRKNDSKLFSVGHEYVLVYARSMSYLKQTGTIWREEKPGAIEIHNEFLRLKNIYRDDYKEMEKQLRSFYKSLPSDHPSKKLSRYGNIDENGVWRDDNMSWPGGGGPKYDVIHPITGKPCAVPEGGWRYSTPEKMEEMIKKGVVQFRETHKDPPIRKTYLVRTNTSIDDIGEDEDIGSQVMGSYFYRSALQASNTLLKLFGEKPFENPKDHEVLMRLIKYVTKDDKKAIILDSFAGSGTTGHAVFQMNNNDGGNRKFILVEMDKNIATTITSERIKRVSEGYSYKEQQEKGLGGGFRYCELGATLFDPNRQIREEVKYNDLAQHVYFIETGQPLPQNAKKNFPLLGVSNETAVYLLYNGILKDKSVNGGNVLTYDVLEGLPKHDGTKVIYGNGSRISKARLNDLGIVFKQIPYEIREM